MHIFCQIKEYRVIIQTMEPNLNETIAPVINPIINPTITKCDFCHQPILSQYYFCPNCGHAVGGKEAPLETTVEAQVKIYALSIILPMVLFILLGKWHGMRYMKSDDPKARRIGQIAWVLMIVSTVVCIWLTYLSYVWITQATQTYLNNSITTDFNI
jgi:hypothetical protein